MKNISINKDNCIGCGACAAICNEMYEINDQGFAEATKDFDTLDEEAKDSALDAASNCPTGAITVEEK